MDVNLKRLKAERIANGITQDEMSSLMGWHSRTPYAKRELGLVPLGANELAKAAEILGYGTDSLGIFFTVNVPDKERKQPAQKSPTSEVAELSRKEKMIWKSKLRERLKK